MSLPGLFSHSATTGSITVRVQPHFAPDQSDPGAGHWVWHYHVRIENEGDAPVRLLDRHWIIVDGYGIAREVRGDGVVGEQPLIPPGGAYDYVSGCPLATPMGTMRGSYGMIDEAGQRFDVEIPAFDLLAPGAKRAAN